MLGALKLRDLTYHNDCITSLVSNSATHLTPTYRRPVMIEWWDPKKQILPSLKEKKVSKMLKHFIENLQAARFKDSGRV